MEVHSLASGSSGNAYIILHKGRALLLDAGLSGKRTYAGLAAAGIDPACITAILVTHEHNDHTAGAGILCRRLGVPLYMTAGTWMAAKAILGNIPEDKIYFVSPGTAFSLNDLEVWALPVCHDACEPVNYIFDTGKCRAAVLTDTGCVTGTMVNALAACNAIVLEANHDLKMLEQGPYPRALKQRVASETGHLSNLQAARVLAQLAARGRISQARLGHLSAVNNSPEIAITAVEQFLAARGMDAEPIYRSLQVLPRHKPGPVLQVK